MQILRPFKTIALFCAFSLLASITGCEQTQNNPKPNIPSASYIVITPEPLTLTTELPGRVKACIVSEVRPQVSGIIKERLFVEGADIKAGDVLYRIDPARYQAAHKNAQAELMTAKANLNAARMLEERHALLVKTNAVSRQDYDNAKAAHAQVRARVAAAEASLEAAAINLEYTEVKAPVSGRIGRSFVTPGALVTENQEMPLATVQRLDTVYVDVTQASSEWLSFQEAITAGAINPDGDSAMQVGLLLENGRPYALKGHLELTDVTVNQSTGVITIRAVFPNPEGILLPGMYVRAIVEQGVKNDAILVPQKAVSRDSGGVATAMVLMPDDALQNNLPVSSPMSTVTRRSLTLSRSVGNRWLVEQGLQEGEMLLVEGAMRLQNGQLVRGVPENSRPALAENDSDRIAAQTTPTLATRQ